MVGFVNPPQKNSFSLFAPNDSGFSFFVCIALLLPFGFSTDSLQAADDGWGKATSTSMIQHVNAEVEYTYDVADPVYFVQQDANGSLKATSVPQPLPVYQAQQIPQAYQVRSESNDADGRIRYRQQGDLKPGTSTNAVQSVFFQPALRPAVQPIVQPTVQPVVHEVVLIPQENTTVTNFVTPEQTVIMPPVGTKNVPSHTLEATEYYEPIFHSRCNCLACREQQPSHWISLEALVWWGSDVSIPALVSTSPTGTAANLAGIEGANSDILLGNEDIMGFDQGGFRARYGQWNDIDQVSGWEMEFLLLAQKGENYFASSDGNPILARPFTNVSGSQPPGGIRDSQLIAFPGLNSGSISVTSETRTLSAGLRYLHEIYLDYGDDEDCGESFGDHCNQNSGSNSRVYLTLGPRFYHLGDKMNFREEFTSVATGNEHLLTDTFRTKNNFFGGEIGLKARRRKGPWQADLGLGLAIGATRQDLDVNGYTRIRSLNNGSEYNAGFLAQSSNIGNHDDTQFSLVPRFEFDLSWQFADGWSAKVGYNLLYWSSVLRAGEQIDSTINADLLPPPIAGSTGPNRPSAILDDTGYLAQGVSFGIERRF